MSDMLAYEGTIVVPRTISMGADRYLSNRSILPISRMGDDFAEWFLVRAWVPEETHEEHSLQYYRFLNDVTGKAFLAEFNKVGITETTFSDLFAVMKMQQRMNGGVLARSDVKMFLIRDLTDTPRLVFVCWFKNGWNIWARDLPAGPTSDVYIRPFRIFSRVPQ
jgi:hypothetical protein